ncbi:MAG: prepilin peptidase [Patescibacteria group bacterium]|nr:prepilin peptidase [Patescibacteria group bacterium]
MIYVWSVFVFIFGLVIGSFLNCLIWRLYKKEGMWNRSYCPACRQQIAWYDNIPVLSFILLRGKCRHCRKRISIQYPIVEFLTGVLFLIAFLNNESGIMNNGLFLILNSKFLILTLRDWFIVAVMTVIFIYDLRWYLILDKITLPACLIVFILNLALGISWLNLVISAAIGGGFFLIQFLVSRGKWIGGGDIRLGLLMGFSLGDPSRLILAILLAYFIGSVIGLGLIISKRKRWNSEVPFGVFLASATIFTVFWGEKIINWYLGLF